MRKVAHNCEQKRNVAHNREQSAKWHTIVNKCAMWLEHNRKQNAYKVLLGEVQSLHSVLQHELVLELIAALRSFASRVFSPKPDR